MNWIPVGPDIEPGDYLVCVETFNSDGETCGKQWLKATLEVPYLKYGGEWSLYDTEHNRSRVEWNAGYCGRVGQRVTHYIKVELP